MKYFIDTEFIEGFHKPLFGKKRHFIDLISIGIVCEDGREYYAISKEFNPKDADKWVKDNVISKLGTRYDTHFDERDIFDPMIHEYDTWKSNKKIAKEIYEFICPYEIASDYAGLDSIDVGAEAYLKQNPPEFYAYYADYDWVLFCSLFGRMIDLPKGFPMYCKDLKQTLDEKALICKEWTNIELIKDHPDYPVQKTEHNALADARWNFELYKFLNKIG